MNKVTTMCGHKPDAASNGVHLRHWMTATLSWTAMACALAQPAQRPLLVSVSGAKPNMMISLDNSGSMGDSFSTGYALKHNLASETPEQFAATRSWEFNALYYNPRITYTSRVDAAGTPFPKDSSIDAISNQESAKYRTDVYIPSYRDYVLKGSAILQESHFPVGNIPWNWYSYYHMQGQEVVPKHITHSQTRRNTPAFTYAICDSWKTDKENASNGCTLPRLIHVKRGMSTLIELPSDHRRTECSTDVQGRATCTGDQEMDNIINWYRFYSNRMRATQTALGQAFQSKSLTDGSIRVGYQSINLAAGPNGAVPGEVLDLLDWTRGVRFWKRGSSDNMQFYKWLYGNVPAGQTPLHNAFDRVAAYYLASSNQAQENPWAVDPSKLHSASNPEMSCRRSYRVMLSDGAWSYGLDSAKAHIGASFDNQSGPQMPKGGATTPSGNDFAYNPDGLADNRQAYVPYGANATGGLADLAARDYWHVDFRPDLANDVPTRTGQPTYWQNVRTYTIGYQIRPSGDGRSDGTGLTFDAIDNYRAQYLAELATPAKPSWPNAELNTSNLANGGAMRIDDFIQAGFTGGGRGISVSSAEEIRTAIDSILADILNVSGNDAGTTLGLQTGEADGLEGRLKYFVEYKTTDNLGDIKAKKIDAKGYAIVLAEDANGQKPSPDNKVFWSADKQMQDHDARRVFSITGTDTGVEFKGRLDALPSDIQSELRTGARAANLPADSRFVDYLRGKRLVTDQAGDIYRVRDTLIGAIVNSSPVMLGNGQHLGYDETSSTVEGKDSYSAYRDQLTAAKEVLVVATNAGVVHAFDAANGKEMAAFMPRRTLRGLLDQADPKSSFRYVLDGPIQADDVYSNGSWQQLLVGTGGRGERVIYGLRIPIHSDGTRTPGAGDFLWETGSDRINTPQFAIGHLTHEARIGQTESGQWVAILSSGHFNGFSDGSRHGLLVLDALTGRVIRTIPLPTQYSAGDGMGGVTVVRNAQKRITTAYVGDARGQLWRFNLKGDPTSWKVSYAKPLFQAPDQRPIYAAPAWQAHPKGGRMVVVATGKLIEESDESDVQFREGVFGIWDPTSRSTGEDVSGFETVLPDQLLEQTSTTRTVGEQTVEDFTRHRIDWRIHRGWKYMLGGANPHTSGPQRPGERVIDQLRNTGPSVDIYSVIINRSNKDENCEVEAIPKNGKYSFNALDGSAKPTFDIDGDGVSDVAMLLIDSGGYSRNTALVSGVSWNKMTPAQQRLARFATNDGESDDDNTRCVGGSYASVGVSDGSILGRVTCSGGWSRHQYQLTQVPQ